MILWDDKLNQLSKFKVHKTLLSMTYLERKIKYTDHDANLKYKSSTLFKNKRFSIKLQIILSGFTGEQIIKECWGKGEKNYEIMAWLVIYLQVLFYLSLIYIKVWEKATVLKHSEKNWIHYFNKLFCIY